MAPLFWGFLVLTSLEAGFALRLGDEDKAVLGEKEADFFHKTRPFVYDNELGWMGMKYKDAYYSCVVDANCKLYGGGCDKCVGASLEAKRTVNTHMEADSLGKKGICTVSSGKGLCGPWYDENGRFIPLAEWEQMPEYQSTQKAASEPKPGKWTGELKLGPAEYRVERGFGPHHPNFGDFEVVPMDKSTYNSGGSAVAQLNADPEAPRCLAAVFSTKKNAWYLFWRDDEFCMQKKANVVSSDWYHGNNIYLRIEHERKHGKK